MKAIKYVGKAYESLTTGKIYEVNSYDVEYSIIKLSLIDDNNKIRYFNIAKDSSFFQDATKEYRSNTIAEILM